jgi:YD repeat-containing protein
LTARVRRVHNVARERRAKKIVASFVCTALIGALLQATGKTSAAAFLLLPLGAGFVWLWSMRLWLRRPGGRGLRILAFVVCAVAAAGSPFLHVHEAGATPVASDDFNDNQRDAGSWDAKTSGKQWAETPDASSLDVTGDIDIRSAVAMDDWTPAVDFSVYFAGKWTSNQQSYGLRLRSNGTLSVFWDDDGAGNSIADDSTVAPSVADGGTLAIRGTVDVQDAGHPGFRRSTFFTKATSPSTAAADVASDTGWIQLGSAITTNIQTSLYSGSASLSVGTLNASIAPLSGTVYGVVIKNGINGTTVANPDFTSVANGTTQFNDATGRPWSLHRAPTVSETNQRLEVTIPATAAGSDFYAKYESTCYLTGNFDTQVDYELLTWPPSNGVRVGLATEAGITERVSGNPGSGYGDVYLTDLNSSLTMRSTSDTSGTLRVTRSGSQVSGYYLSGGQWVQIASATTTPADIKVNLAAWSADSFFSHTLTKVAFDNFTLNAGTKNCGPPIITDGNLIGGCSIDGDAVAPCDTMSDPVIPSIGAFVHHDKDIELPGGRLPFRIERSYTSIDTADGPLGVGWSANYGESLNLGAYGNATLRATNGQRVLFTRDSDGAFVAPPNGRSRLAATQTGYELTRKDHTVHTFDAQGRLTKIEDAAGNSLTLAYNQSGVLDHITDAIGASYGFTFDGSGHATRVDLPDGRHVAYGYTTGRLTSYTDLRGKTTTYGYDAGGRLQSIVDPDAHELVHNVYDASGRVSSQQDAMGKTSTFSYTSGSNGLMTTTMTDARGKVWQDISRYNVHQSRTDPNDAQTTYSWDSHIAPSTQPRAGGSPRTLTWDARGNLTSSDAVSPFNYHESYTYDASDHVTAHTDGNNKTTTYGYDADGNLTSVTEPGGATTTITRDPDTGLPTSVTDQRGKTWTYTYDAAGHVLSTTSPLGHKTTMTYDVRGFMVSRTDPRGNELGANPADFTTTYTYDDAGHLLTTTDPLGGVTTNVYDDAGRLASTTDARNKTTSYEYDAASEVTKITAPDGGLTTFAYDDSGHLLTQTDAEGGVTNYAYDDAGRLSSKTDSRGKTTTYTHDDAGDLLSETTPLGHKTSYTYDVFGRRTSMVEARGNESGASAADFTTSYAYDAVGNELSETDPLGSTTAHTYDHKGRILTTTDPAGKVTTYTYDGAGHQLTVTDPLSHTTTNAYDDDGHLTSTTDPRGKTATFAYDAAGNTTSTTSPLGHKASSTYDALSRVTARIDPRGNEPGAIPADYRAS